MTHGRAQAHAGSRPSVGGAPTSPTWDRDDLARRTCVGLAVAKRVLAFLAEDGYRDEEDAEGSFGPDKPFAETAMLLHVASGVTGQPRIAEAVDELARLLVPHARSPRTAFAMALHPSISLQLAMPHVLLTRLGLTDERFDRLLTLSTESSAHLGQEVVPNRALERMWLESVWRGAPPGAAFDEAAASSALNHPVDLIWGTREDAYAHTHTFMYFTDFGYAPRRLPRPREEILGESAALLARSLLLEDYDLTAEVLMAWPLTGAAWTPAATFAFRVLAELEDSVGFLPAKHGTPEKYARLAGTDRTKYALAASYHTVYVMGMLCALSLRSSAPPAALGGPTFAEELLEELSSSIPEVDTPWRHTFRRLDRAEQRVLAPFLLDLALLSRARSHDFPAVGSLLGLAVEHGLADAPLCAQSAELLHRVSVCADADAGSAAPAA